MNTLDDYPVQCPYCGEQLTLLVDRSIASQSYIEDCQVCCQPILLNISVTYDGQVSVIPHQENE